jgi:hypothetical protein
MAVEISRSVNKLQDQLARLRGSLVGAREKANEAVASVVQTTEVTAVAFALGIVNGRWSGVEFLGVPLDLWLAGGAKGFALMGIQPEHLHNMGDGALASYSTTLGAGIGREMRVKALGVPGANGAAAKGRLTDQELARLAGL